MVELAVRVVGVVPGTTSSGTVPKISSLANVTNIVIVNDSPIPVVLEDGVTEDNLVSVSGYLQDQISSVVVSGGGTYQNSFQNTTQVVCAHNFNSIAHSTVIINESGQTIEGSVIYGINTDVINFNYLQSGTVLVSV